VVNGAAKDGVDVAGAGEDDWECDRVTRHVVQCRAANVAECQLPETLE
jgi:hypothetical protein